MTETAASADTPQTRPYFLPAELDFEELPETVRAAIKDIIQPAYEVLVVQALDPLEREAGASLVFLMLLEILQQFDLGSELGAVLQAGGNGGEGLSDEALARYARVTGSKEKAGKYLLRIREFVRTHPPRLPAWEGFVSEPATPDP